MQATCASSFGQVHAAAAGQWQQQGPQNTPEALHDGIPLHLWHVAVHGGNCEVILLHLLCQPVHLSLCIAEDDCLCDGKGVVQVTKCVKLPLLLLDCHKELLDALQSRWLSCRGCVMSLYADMLQYTHTP